MNAPAGAAAFHVTTLASLALAGSLAAQGTTRLVEPGDAAIRLTLTAPEARRFRFVTIGDSAPVAASYLDETLQTGRENGRAVIYKTTAEGDSSAAFVDTLVMDRQTLEPLRYVSRDAARSRTLRFTGRAVTGEVRTATGAVTPVEVKLERPVFFGGAFYTVLRALPVNDSTDVTVPFFRAYDLQTIRVRYRAIGSEAIASAGAGQRAWRILVQVGEAFSVYWMDQRTHELLRVVNFAPGGGEGHLVPVPAEKR